MQITSLRNLQQQQQLNPPTNPPSTTEIQQDDAWDANLVEADDDYDVYNNNNLNKNNMIDTTDDVFKNYYNGNDELSLLHNIGLIVLIGGLLFMVKRRFSSGDGRWNDTIPNRRRSAMF